MEDVTPHPPGTTPTEKVEIPPERENLEYSTYLEMFKAEFPGIAEQLLDVDGNVMRSAEAGVPDDVSDEELLKGIVHEILEIPPKEHLS